VYPKFNFGIGSRPGIRRKVVWAPEIGGFLNFKADISNIVLKSKYFKRLHGRYRVFTD